MIRQAFNRSAAKPDGSSGNDFLEAILRERPDLKGQTAYFPKQGARAHAVIIGKEVFKGPRVEWEVQGFDIEHEVLKKMSKSGLPIPKVTCIGKKAVFYGMERMPGIMLSGYKGKMLQKEQKQLAKDLVDFAIGMARCFPEKNGRVMRHEDLHTENVLVDPKTGKLTAVIDFGKVDYYDKADACPVLHDLLPSGLNDVIQKEYKSRLEEASRSTKSRPSATDAFKV